MLGGSGRGGLKAGTHSIAGRDWGEGWRWAGGHPLWGSLTRRRPGSGRGAAARKVLYTVRPRHAGALVGARPPPWRLDTGSRALWARGENTRFRSSLPVGELSRLNTHTQDPAPVGQGLDTRIPFLPERRLQRQAGGRRPRSDSTEDGLTQPVDPWDQYRGQTSTKDLNRNAHCINLTFKKGRLQDVCVLFSHLLSTSINMHTWPI